MDFIDNNIVCKAYEVILAAYSALVGSLAVLPSFWNGILFAMKQWNSVRGRKEDSKLRTHN